MDGVVEIDASPKGDPTIRPARIPNKFAKRLVFEGVVDSAVSGNERDRGEVDVQCTFGDGVRVKHNETFGIFKQRQRVFGDIAQRLVDHSSAQTGNKDKHGMHLQPADALAEHHHGVLELANDAECLYPA